MTGDDGGSTPAIRMWWAAPFALVVVTGVIFVAVVLPALAGSTNVPTHLVVHRSPARAASSSPTVTPRPVASTPAAQPTHSTTVVPPEQPVVRESDDRTEVGGRRQGSGGNDD